MEEKKHTGSSRIARLISRGKTLWTYLNTGIWSDPSRKWWLNILRTVSLSVRSFLSRDIRTHACALTYHTILAVVPALALLFAIGRGFGFQTVLQEELYTMFPAQRLAIEYMLGFVDTYLSQASGGVFVGVGILFLVWTLISLLGNVEDKFNLIWGLKDGRGIWRKVSDYTAMLLILPILMICASGINILLSSTLKAVFQFEFLTPVVTGILEAVSWLMTWLFFTAVYMFVPYTRVKFINAFVSGVIAGSGFLLLQWLFVTGTLYVTRYNAIYGSFAVLPLMLLWLQLVWMIVLAGAVVCYSSQNVFSFNLDNEVSTISTDYRNKVTIAVAAIFVQRFLRGRPAVTERYLMDEYEIPARLVTDITDRLCTAGILSRVVLEQRKDIYGLQLSVDPASLTVGSLLARLFRLGSGDFVPGFRDNFPGVEQSYSVLRISSGEILSSMPLSELDIKLSEYTDKTTDK